MWNRDVDMECRELTRECQAFLDGQFVDYLADRDEDVPVWAWTNLLAHGTQEELRLAVTRHAMDWEVVSRPWLEARAYVAGEVLEATQRGEPLCRVQRTRLIPLELRLASDYASDELTPADWVSMVLAAISPIMSWKSRRTRA